ncbi:MAG: hypothetical protein HN403_20155 [Rhodospirillales bacterium]|nr:hypothetical protein [Rhodospirillales bacterium]
MAQTVGWGVKLAADLVVAEFAAGKVGRLMAFFLVALKPENHNDERGAIANDTVANYCKVLWRNRPESCETEYLKMG